MSHRREEDSDRLKSRYYYRNPGVETTRRDYSFERQRYDYHSRRAYEKSQAYDNDPRRGCDTSSTSAAQRHSPALRSNFAGNRHWLDEPNRDPRDDDRPRQRYAEIFQPRRRSPSPIRPTRRSYLDDDYGDGEYRRSSSHDKPEHRSGSRHRIAFEEHRADKDRYVYRYDPQHSDDLYDDTSSVRRSSRRKSHDRRYDDEDEYRCHRR